MNYQLKTRDQHLDAENSPKRILTLDGGGVRGMMSLSYLKIIEELLKKRHGNDPDFRLCHYFDLIAGTSTGAIIASALAMGNTVEFIQNKYRALANRVFRRRFFKWGIVSAKYDKEALEQALKDHEVIGPATTLGSPEIKTGILVVAKRMDKASTWLYYNNPKGKYFQKRPGGKALANADLLLWQIVRASTAAPYYFKPERIEIAADSDGGETKAIQADFVDGGVSTANNPALKAFQVATLQGYRLNWKTGKDNILLVSIGTGRRNPVQKIPKFAAGNAINALLSIMDDCNQLVETQMQWMSQSNTARMIDREIGTLSDEFIGGQPLLTYQRYNVEFSESWLQEHLALLYDAQGVRRIEAMDNPENLNELAKLGDLAGQKQIAEEHFPSVFDLK